MSWTSWCRRVPAILAAAMLAVALSGPADAASEPIDREEATRFIDDVGSQIVATLNDESKSQDERNAFFTDIMLKHIDFRELGRRVLGRMARKSTEQQRDEFYPLFACFFIDTVIEMLQGLEIDSYEIKGSKTYPNQEVVVAVLVNKGDGTTLDTGWRLQNKGGTLSVVDVNVQGASAVGHFRDRMATSTSQNITGQIAKLKQTIGDSPTLPIVLQTMSAS